MHKGTLFAVTATVATVALAGCSTKTVITKPASSSPPSSAVSTSTSQASSPQTGGASAPLGGTSCVEITQANVDLATAKGPDDARKAGDAFEKYDLPDDVKEAVEHFVSTGGAQFDDPNYDKFNNAIEVWIKKVCPL